MLQSCMYKGVPGSASSHTHLGLYDHRSVLTSAWPVPDVACIRHTQERTDICLACTRCCMYMSYTSITISLAAEIGANPPQSYLQIRQLSNSKFVSLFANSSAYLMACATPPVQTFKMYRWFLLHNPQPHMLQRTWLATAGC